MAHDTDPLALLRRSLDQLTGLIEAAEPGMDNLPTPCRSWTVGDLIGHLGVDCGNFATAVRGGSPNFGRRLPEGDADPREAFQLARDDLLAAWDAADLDTLVPSMTGGEEPLVRKADQQVAEFGVHAWDLARAVGQDTASLAPEVAEHGLAWARGMLSEQFRGSEEEGKSFGPEVVVADDAPAYDRLAGWFGRDPAWTAEAAGAVSQ